MTGGLAVAPAPAHILGCRVDRLDMAQTLARCEELIDAGDYAQHVVVNAAKLVMLRDDPRLSEIVEQCALVNADGQSIVWASRMLGDPLPSRVAGIDLMSELLRRAARRGWGVYILGARPEVLATAVESLQARYPGLRVVGSHHGYFDDSQAADVCAQIRSALPDLLLVAMSSPRKEYFLAEHGPELGVPFAMGVGGAIDVVAGVVRRAPPILQRLGLEWLYRLAQEPGRLAARYAATNWKFAVLLLAEIGRRRLRAPAR